MVSRKQLEVHFFDFSKISAVKIFGGHAFLYRHKYFFHHGDLFLGPPTPTHMAMQKVLGRIELCGLQLIFIAQLQVAPLGAPQSGFACVVG